MIVAVVEADVTRVARVAGTMMTISSGEYRAGREPHDQRSRTEFRLSNPEPS